MPLRNYKLFTVFLVLLVSLEAFSVGAALYLTNAARKVSTRENAIADLAIAARLFAEWLQRSAADGDREKLRELTIAAAQATGLRFTLIAENGQVITDSAENAARMENHRSRPEFTAALAHNFGSDARFSATLQENCLYAAIAGTLDKYGKIVIRAARTTAKIDRYFAGDFYTAMKITLAACLPILALAICGARKLLAPLQMIAREAQKLAAGEPTDFPRALPTDGVAENQQLADSLSALAHERGQKISTAQSQQQEIRQIFTNFDDGVIILDPKQKLLLHNDRAAQLLEISETDPREKTLAEISRRAALLGQIPLTDAAGPPAELDLMCDGKILNLHVIRKTLTVGRETVGEIILLRDFTAIRAMLTTRKDFVANVSHELRSPITSLRGYLETLQSLDDRDRGQRDKFLAIALKNCLRLHAIVDDLLVLSRLEQEPDELRRAQILSPVLPILNAAVESLTKKAPVAASKIAITCAPDLMIAANAQLLEQAVFNLLDNAQKYGGETITLAAESLADKIRICVADNGAGIAPNDCERIFERFYRVDRGRNRETPAGTGLGLAIVKHIAQAHRGTVSVQSELGRSTIFTLTLPAKS